MSYILHPIAIELQRLKRTIGSGSSRLLKRLEKKHRDELLEDDEETDVADGEITLRTALRNLIAGRPWGEACLNKYGYALLWVSQQEGKMLDNDAWSAMDLAWIEQVDTRLAAAGLEAQRLSVEKHLIERGPGFEFPVMSDFPAIGHLRQTEMVEAMPALKTAIAKIDDQEPRESAEQLSSWLDHCLRTHCDLLCFCF